MIGKTDVTVNHPNRLWPRLLSCLLLTCWVSSPTLAIANPSLPASPTEPASPLIDGEKFRAGVCPDSVAGITDTSASAVGLTLPSLWWIRDQVAAQPQFGHKLLEKWLACAEPGQLTGRVDMLVNPQGWTLLDYLARYEFVHRLGTVISGYGYNLRVFNRKMTLLASYTCQFESTAKTSEGAAKAKSPERQPFAPVVAAVLRSPPPAVGFPTCTLALDSSSQGGFRGQPNSFDGAFPTGSGTGRQ